MPEIKRLAILDDYQGVTLQLGPWDRLPESIQLEQYRDTVTGPALLATLSTPAGDVTLSSPAP